MDIFFFYSDINLDDDLFLERKREIKKAVGLLKKREVVKIRFGVIKV